MPAHPMPAEKSVATKYVLSTVTASSDDANLPSCIISTITTDRDHDHVIPEGMDATNFLKVPVLMWSHGGSDRYAALPIGTVTSLHVVPGQGISAQWRWLDNDPMADRVRNAWDQGVVRGTSIGFRPIVMEPNEAGGTDHLAWELLELSICPIPANPDAVRTLKALKLMDDDAAAADDLIIKTRTRVLSAANESQLRAVLVALTYARGVLDRVLSELTPDADDDEAVLQLCADARDVPVAPLIDDQGQEHLLTIDPTVMRQTIADVMVTQLHESLIVPVSELVERALDKVRGRVQ